MKGIASGCFAERARENKVVPPHSKHMLGHQLEQSSDGLRRRLGDPPAHELGTPLLQCMPWTHQHCCSPQGTQRGLSRSSRVPASPSPCGRPPRPAGSRSPAPGGCTPAPGSGSAPAPPPAPAAAPSSPAPHAAAALWGQTQRAGDRPNRDPSPRGHTGTHRACSLQLQPIPGTPFTFQILRLLQHALDHSILLLPQLQLCGFHLCQALQESGGMGTVFSREHLMAGDSMWPGP